jgi:hypothetical protein
LIIKNKIIKKNIENKDNSKLNNPKNSKNSIPWDPVNAYYDGVVKVNCDKLEKKYDKIKNNPKFPKFLFFSFLIGIFLSLFLIFIISELFVILLIISIIGTPLIYSHYKSIAKDIIKYEIAKQNNWFYDPYKSTAKWNALRSKIPEIFNKGTDSQFVEDQFWGKIEYENMVYDFYSGVFVYTITSHSDKNRSSTTYNTHFFIIKNDHELNNEFNVVPNNFFRKIFNKITKKHITTSSIEFNKAFTFSYRGKKIEKENDIIKYINPKVQTKLLDLKDKKGSYSVSFKKNYVVYLFTGLLVKKLKTNFIKSHKLNEEDELHVKTQITSVINDTNEIMHHLN